jgi:hypothetical protein
MDTTLTLNDGTTNVSFTHKHNKDNMVLYTSPSPQGDFDGVRRLERKAAKAKTGILTRTSNLLMPIYDADLQKYTGFIQVRVSLSAPATAATADATKALTMSLNAFTVGTNPDFKGEFCSGIDAL